VKYLLILFFSMPQPWPFAERLEFAQLGPFDSTIACEKAAAHAEPIVQSIGASRVVSFCTSIKTDWKPKGK
jgi:hypothetical protein